MMVFEGEIFEENGIMTQSTDSEITIVVGGGLAGLTAAAYLARAGRNVRLLESAQSLGGRAMTRVDSDFHFNMGAHALYVEGAAKIGMDDLGVEVRGSLPPSSGLWAVNEGRFHLLPSGVVTLLRTDLLSMGEKVKFAGLLSRLPKQGGRGWHGRSAQEWLEETASTPTLRLLLQGLLRLSTYANDPERQDAGFALDQLRLALRANVLYVDGGWQTIVEGLGRKAREGGARIETGVRVESLSGSAGAWNVALADGRELEGAGVVLAVPPESAVRLLRTAGVETPWLGKLRPVKAACLDLGLSELPRPDRLFALGLDEPLYLSVHSATARLCAEGQALVHVAKYLGDERPQRHEIEAELEAYMDRVQPGWRDFVVERRLLPEMTVVHALAEARSSRPAVVVPGASGLFLAGDWVGDEGILSDTAVASARHAVDCILGEVAERKAA